ncbi:MAG: hypothetical protein JWP42_2414 [Pseudomonas sp.]|nr:hypothetical protein [Pseudomonas sp.]
MSWTRIGTVSVTNNSNAVTGTGTAFLTNSRIGDAFLGPDGVLYEVINVGSDTSISISPNYKGATNASAAYALIPVQGYPKVLADAFNTINNQFGATLAVLGNSGTQTGIKSALGLATSDGLTEGATNLYFTQSRVLATPLTALSVAVNTAVVATDSVLVGMGKLQAQVSAALPKAGGALSGALNEAPRVTLDSAGVGGVVAIGAAACNSIIIGGATTITAFDSSPIGATRRLTFGAALTLTNNSSIVLPNGLDIVTGAGDTAEFLSVSAGVWRCIAYLRYSGKALAFAYDRSNLLGTVSQSGGIPTGSAFQYSANANGVCLKFADGTMLTASRQACTISSWTGLGSGFWYSPKVGAFPMPGTFITPPICTMTLSDFSSVSWYSTNAVATVNTYPNFYIVCALNTAPVTMYMDFIASGRWY